MSATRGAHGIRLCMRSLRDGKRYVGLTNDPYRRLHQHNAGMVSSTRARRPFVIIHLEEFTDRSQAAIREKFLKTGVGRKELARLLAEQT